MTTNNKIQVYSFSEIGQRSHNEDAIYPNGMTHADEHLYIVCDGMGGTEGGEIASRLTCDTISTYFNQYVQPDQSVSSIEQHIHKALDAVHARIEDLILEEPHLDKMGTTLALLYMHHHGVTIAHIGDSRVYHIQAVSFWHTEDHSLVYELYKIGTIQKSEMATHSNKNIITKVIRGRYERDIPDIKHIHNISEGDYFLLMSDGVLEGLDERRLIAIVNDKKQTDAEKVNNIKYNCAQNSTDNYSLIFIKIGA